MLGKSLLDLQAFKQCETVRVGYAVICCSNRCTTSGDLRLYRGLPTFQLLQDRRARVNVWHNRGDLCADFCELRFQLRDPFAALVVGLVLVTSA